MSAVIPTGRASSPAQLRQRPRRLSTPAPRQIPRPLQLCGPLPLSLEALDLSSMSPTQALASLRYIILSYLADLERRLSDFASPDFSAFGAMGEMTIEDARQWAQTALEMLQGIRADVCSHLPEFHFAEMSTETVGDFVKSHLPSPVPVLTGMRSHFPEMPDVRSHLPDMSDVRSHFPDMPHLPDSIHNVSSQISDMRTKLVSDVRSKFHDLNSHRPLSYIPVLSDHLKSLHSHLSSVSHPSSSADFDSSPFTSGSLIVDILDALLSSDLVEGVISASPDIAESEVMLEQAAKDVANAIRRSLDGVRLIQYSDLPHAWRNNPFVVHGYRFIPIERWPLILMSWFAFHNETLNIYTHLVPLLLWGTQLVPILNQSYTPDTPETLFMFFALLCLTGSVLWHTMAGCANRKSMEFCARVDYVGIGWLISASVGTVVHYGFQCNPSLGRVFLGLCFITGLAGNIFPFMEWFNQHEYRLYRILFFVSMALSAVGPLATLSIIHSRSEALAFIGPVLPSLGSYVVGLIFYALHFPERALPESVQRKLDFVGGGSHSIWHCFIVLAVHIHRSAIGSLKKGIVEQCALLSV